MEFDRSRVYSAINADELHEGDKVIVSDTMSMLTLLVRETTDSMELATLKKVHLDNEVARFGTSTGNWCLAYLIERKENCTNCGEGKWDAEHKKILCDPVDCGNGNVVFRNHEIEVCEYWKPKNKTEQKAEKDCDNCGQRCDGYGKGEVCSQWKSKTEKHSDYNHCEEARKAYACAMTNACSEKHYRPFKDTDELIKVWEQKWSEKTNGQKWHDCNLNMPLIWVRRKTDLKNCGHLVIDFNCVGVAVQGQGYAMRGLFANFEFLDGSPCGVEE